MNVWNFNCTDTDVKDFRITEIEIINEALQLLFMNTHFIILNLHFTLLVNAVSIQRIGK